MSDDFTLNRIKTRINLLNPMLSRILGVMFKVKQLLTENHLLLLHIATFVVHFNSFVVIRFSSSKVSKNHQTNQVPSIKKRI